MPASLKPYPAHWFVCLALLWPLAALATPGSEGAKPATLQKPATLADNQIHWQKGTVDSVFAAAKAGNKPVFLYWGASWCPPCNQVKATIFNRQDFIGKSRFFLPVYIDGDSPGAQKLGARFKVRGYPTMILFKPNGEEITRLPGEVDAERYMQVLTMGIDAARPIKEILMSALDVSRQDNASLTPDDWKLLAYYSWDTDEQQLLPARELSATLRRLAQVSQGVSPEISARFALRALAREATAKEAGVAQDGSGIAQLMAVLGDARLARANFDLLVNYSADIVSHVAPPNSAGHEQLGSAWNASLDRLMADRGLSTTDRLAALIGRIALARLETSQGALSEALLQRTRSEVGLADRETTDRQARQSVISAAADALTEAGLLDESDALLKAELKRSHSPYYFMLGLAANAKKRGDPAAAIAWTAKAHAAAKGPATRLQWGATYIKTLVELAPGDEEKIESATKRVLGELKIAPDTFYERNLRSLERVGKYLKEWNRESAHAAVFRRLQARMDGICKQLPAGDPSRTACDNLI